MQDKIKKKRTVGNIEAGAIIAVAVLCDVLQIGVDLLFLIPGIGFFMAPIINRLLDIIIGFFFWLYYMIRGIKFSRKGRMLAFLGTIIGEFIPLLDLAPFWTFDAIYMIISTRREDHEENKKSAEAGARRRTSYSQNQQRNSYATTV